MSAASDHHNKAAAEFVMTVAGQTKSSAELMVVVESTIFGAMLVCQRVHGVQPAVSAGMVEAAVQRATERFTAVEAR